MMKIQFIKSPTGEYGLAYFVGDVANVSNEQGKLLIEAEFAIAVSSEELKEPEQPKPETKQEQPVVNQVERVIKHRRKRK